MAKELDSIIKTGFYKFLLTSANFGSNFVISLEYVPSATIHQSFNESPQPSTESAASSQKEIWTSEQIDDFVLKLGFLDEQGEGDGHIKHFLHINEV